MPSGAPTPGAGRVIAGRYLLLRRLGSGGMGHVWLAHDRRLACEAALKEVVFREPVGAEEREARVARARAEARHAAGLRAHPHVVTVHDVLEHEGLPWIVMEYVADAVDLRELVTRQGPLAPAECARVGLAVLDALTAGHRRGVLHRDVKPANILLAPDRTGAPYGRVLLTDYGISVQPDTGETRYTMASALVGTAGYLAPERATGGAPTAAADLFSLGCTLYFGVEGRGPFERESHLAELTAVVAEEPRPPVRAGALEPVLRALLAKDPGRRPDAAAAEALLGGIVPPRAGTPYVRTTTDPRSEPQWHGSPAPPPGRHRRSRALPAALCAVLALALAGGSAWYALAQREPGGGTVLPYGEAVGLDRALRDGDCVLADWPDGARFSSVPRLTLDPGCRVADGQVMGFVGAGSAGEASGKAAAGCEELTSELRGRLADVRSYAVVPTQDGFAAAGRRAACLVLGTHGPVYGPLGRHRRLGSAFADTATMQKRDCLETRSNRDARLVSCSGPYDELVIGFTRLRAGVTLAEARTESDAACAREVPPGDHGFDPSVYESGSWTSGGAWKSGTRYVICTVRKQNGGTMEGDAP